MWTWNTYLLLLQKEKVLIVFFLYCIGKFTYAQASYKDWLFFKKNSVKSNQFLYVSYTLYEAWKHTRIGYFSRDFGIFNNGETYKDWLLLV